MSQFNYCSLIWMFCNKNLQKNNQIQTRALQIIYNKATWYLDELGELEKSTTVHTKRIITLLTEAFKMSRKGNPIFMSKIFSQKRINYQLRTTNLLNPPKVTDSKYCFNTFGFCSIQLPNQVPDSIKHATSIKHFKTEMLKSWQVIKCTCSVC